MVTYDEHVDFVSISSIDSEISFTTTGNRDPGAIQNIFVQDIFWIEGIFSIREIFWYFGIASLSVTIEF